MALLMMTNLLFCTTSIQAPMHRKTSTFRTIRTHLWTWKSLMSLTKRDIRILMKVLQISDTITCGQRSVCDGLEDRLEAAFIPMQIWWHDHRFAKPVPVLSIIILASNDLLCICKSKTRRT